MFNFPNSPTLGDLYQPVGGPSYQWDGQKWMMTGSAITYTPAYAQRNRIVNGAMQISQELTKGTTYTVSNSFIADQWNVWHVTTGAPAFACVASTGAFPNYLRLNSTVAHASPAAGSYYTVLHVIEGLRIADLLWGSASAKPIVVRFDARSTFAGNVSVSIRNSPANRTYVKNVAIPGDNVFRTYTLAIPGDATGTWARDNTAGMIFGFTVMAGSTYIGAEGWQAGNFFAATGISNWLSVAGQILDIANVGLYLDADGSGIPPAWEMPDEAQELAACMRYYQTYAGDSVTDHIAYGYVQNATTAYVTKFFPVTMRTAPTGSFATAANYRTTTPTTTPTAVGSSAMTSQYGVIGITTAGLTAGNTILLYSAATTAKAAFSARM